VKRSIIGTYFLLLALSSMGLGFSSGVYSNFLRSHGLNELELNTVNIAFFLTIFLFEIPTGLYADVFGRKRSFVISCFLLSASEFVYSGSSTFWGFVTAEIIGGIAVTFASGAYQAWLVDRLKHHGYEEKLTKIFAWESVVKALAIIASSAIGGKMADYSYVWPWFLGGIMSALTGVLSAIIMKEEYFVKKNFNFKRSLTEMAVTTRESWRYLRTDKAFRFILAMGFVLTFTVMAPNMQWQKIFINHLKTNFHVSLLMVGIQITVMAGGYLSLRFLTLCKSDEKKALMVCQVLIGLTIMLTVMWSNLPMILVFFLLHEVFRGAFKPIKDAYLQDMLPSKERATLASFESMYGHLGGALGLLMSGWLATVAGIPTAWAVAGAVMVIEALTLHNHSRKVKK